jgi:hypothetical protein
MKLIGRGKKSWPKNYHGVFLEVLMKNHETIITGNLQAEI